MSYCTKIVGLGGYLPEKIMTNQDFEKILDTSDEWITERTGIKERHICNRPEEQISDMALKASQRALKAANLDAKDLDLILVATTSPEHQLPSTACMLQDKLGAKDSSMAFDLAAACSGFLYGLHVADQFIKTGSMKNILLVGAELLTAFMNFEDRNTAVLFGDGAGAAVLTFSEDSSSSVISAKMSADGSLGNILCREAGGSKFPITDPNVIPREDLYIHLNGREVFKNAVRRMTETSQFVLEKGNLGVEDVDWMIAHQANIRIIQAVGERLGITSEKSIINIEKTGNTSSASIPLAFAEAVEDGRIQRGQKILLTAFGGGVTYGSLLLKY